MSIEDRTQAVHPVDDSNAALVAAVAGYKPVQVKKALRLIASGNIRSATGIRGAYVAISSDGVTRYLVDDYGNCNCHAGTHGERCYHGCAGIMLGCAGRDYQPRTGPHDISADELFERL